MLSNRNSSPTSMTHQLLPLRSTLLPFPKLAGLKPLQRLLVSFQRKHVPLFRFSPWNRTKFTRNCWCPNQEGGYTHPTAVCVGDPIGLHSTTQGGPRVGYIRRGPGKLEACSANGERDGVSGNLRQTYLRRTRCIPGSWVSFRG